MQAPEYESKKPQAVREKEAQKVSGRVGVVVLERHVSRSLTFASSPQLANIEVEIRSLEKAIADFQLLKE